MQQVAYLSTGALGAAVGGDGASAVLVGDVPAGSVVVHNAAVATLRHISECLSTCAGTYTSCHCSQQSQAPLCITITASLMSHASAMDYYDYSIVAPMLCDSQGNLQVP